MNRIVFASALATVILLTSAARAADDSFNYDGITFSGTVMGLRDGKLATSLRGNDLFYDLEKVLVISLASNEKFTNAEIARASDAKKAAALYKEAIRALNNPALKQLAEMRAIPSTAEDGKWVDAVAYFLDVYQAWPVEAVWKARPTKMPDPRSSMLKESADRIEAVVKTIKSEEARKNLRLFEQEILRQAGDTESAGRLAREFSTGIAEDQPRSARSPEAAVLANAGLAEIETALSAKDYSGALKRADALLASAPPEVCVQLFMQKARAYQGQEKADLAVATLLRIPAHYPASPEVPAALLQAGTIEKVAHPAAAKALFQEIVERFPNSKEAVTARNQQ